MRDRERESETQEEEEEEEESARVTFCVPFLAPLASPSPNEVRNSAELVGMKLRRLLGSYISGNHLRVKMHQYMILDFLCESLIVCYAHIDTDLKMSHCH